MSNSHNQQQIADIFRQLDWVKEREGLSLGVAADSGGNEFNVVKGLKLALRREDYRALSEIVEWVNGAPDILSDGLPDRFWGYVHGVKMDLLDCAAPRLSELRNDNPDISSGIVGVSTSILTKGDIYVEMEIALHDNSIDIDMLWWVYIEIVPAD